MSTGGAGVLGRYVVPFFITLGPFLIVQGLHVSITETAVGGPLAGYSLALTGAIMLTGGLLLLYKSVFDLANRARD